MAVWSVASLQSVIDTRRIDADHYRPEYLRITASLSWAPPLKQFVQEIIHPAEFSRKYSGDGWKVVRTQNVRPLRMEFDSNEVFLSEKVASKLNKNHLRSGDILITRTGANFGQCSLFYAEQQPALATSHTFIVRANEKIDSTYLALFLNTMQGRQLIDRGMYGSSQPEIAPRFLLRLPIPRFAESIEAELAMFVRKAYELRKESISLYKQAHHLLESKLGLDKLSFQKPVGYTARFSELEQSRRSDSEFFNPELRYFWKNLSRRFELMAISKFTSVLKFSNPTYGRNGIPIVTQKHLRTISPEGYGDELRTTDSWQRVNYGAVLQQNDLLFYSVGAYLGKTNIWLNSDKAVPASFITLLRCKNEKNAGFLQVLLNSRYGILQSKCFQSGTSQQYIYPKDIRKFLIPVVNDNLKEKLHLLVVESFEKGLEAKNLLHQAKTLVEQLIEEAVQS